MKTVATESAAEVLKPRASLPAAWKKAAGILKGRKPDALKELRAMRKEWDARVKKFEKRSRA